METQEGPLLLSKTEVASQLGVCVRTVEKLLKNCDLPSVRIGRRRMIPYAALKNFLRRHHVTDASAQAAAAAN